MAAKKAPPKKEMMGPPAPPPKKPSAGARAFGAATAIFVPPELQHEAGPTKRVPKKKESVVVRVPQRTESLSEKKARLARETHARERLRIGKHITSATGANRLDAVPDRIPHSIRSRVNLPLGLGSFSMYKPAHDIALGLGLAAKDKAKGIESWAGEVAHSPMDMLAAMQGGGAGPRTPLPIPRSAYKIGQTLGEAEPLVRPIGYAASEEGQEQLWGKSLTNLVAHGDTPGSKMEAGGLALGIAGILPFGKIGQFVKLGKAMRAAGKIGEALPMTPAREAAYKTIAQQVGEVEAHDAMLVLDNYARQAAESKAAEAAKFVEPDDFYKLTDFRAANWADVKNQPGMKAAQFQPNKWIDHPDADHLPTTGSMVRVPDGRVGLYDQSYQDDYHRHFAQIELEDGEVVHVPDHDLVGVVPETAPARVTSAPKQVGDEVMGSPGTRRERQKGYVVDIADDGKIGVQFYPLDSAVEYHPSNQLIGKPKLQSVKFQTGAGPRHGLVEGYEDQPIPSKWENLSKKAAFKNVNKGEFVSFFTEEGDLSTAEKVGQGQFLIANMDTGEEAVHDMASARDILYRGQEWNLLVQDAPDPVEGIPHGLTVPGQVPVFKPGLPPLVEKQPTKMVNGVEVFSAPKEQLEKTLQNALQKPSEWGDTGMEGFFDSYPAGAAIPKQDLTTHLASSLNSYNLDEVIYRSDSGHQIPARFGGQPHPTQWQGYNKGALLVRDPTPEEPYVEIYMKLRPASPRDGVIAPEPYRGKGEIHWDEQDVVGHVRMHIVTDAEGKKSLVVDEIQSDWASQWNTLKKYAAQYEGPETALTTWEKAEQHLIRLEDQVEEMQSHLAILNQDPGRYDQEIADTHALLQEHGKQIDDLTQLLQDVQGPPPLGNKQMEAIVRRTLRFAHDEGVDRVIVVQGDVQAIRNQAFTTTPKGRAIQIHDNPNWQADLAKWKQDTEGMTQAEVQAYARDPKHQTGMVKAFMDLYGQGDEAGKVQKIFEKEMGEKGSVKKGIFEGGYADEGQAITRQRPHDDFEIDGVKYMEDPDYPEPKRGDRVQTVEGPGIVQAVYQNGEVGVDLGRRMVVKPSHYVQVIIPDPNAAPVKNFSHMMDGYVIEMTDGAKAKASVPMAYYQKRAWEAIPKGATEFLADGRRVIYLFENADISTIIHELAHVGLEDMSEVDRAIIMRNFNGLKTTADHEMYARSFERYIYEGHAMNSALDGTFAKLKTYMQAIYQHVNNIGGVANPEVKQVFDRMVVQQESPEQQLVRRLKEAPRVRRAQEVGYSEERARRIANQFEEWDRQGGKEEFLASMAHLKGELPKEEFTAMQDLSPEVVDSLVRTIRNSERVRPYQKVRAATAIIKATEGSVPTRSELALLDKIFGGQVGFRKVRKRGAGDWMLEIWNIPRAISASFDLSAPFRQGAVAYARHPIIASKTMKPMVKAAMPFKRGKEATEDVAEDIATRPNSINGKYGKAKLATGTHADPHSSVGEEPFNSLIASHLPGVKHSERAYETFLHKLRADIFDEMIAKAERINVSRTAKGKKPIDIESKEFLEGLGRYVNGITGRGTLPDNSFLPFEKGADLLNAIFFSPRLLASRVNMVSPVYWTKLWQANPMLFRAQMQANAAAAASGVGILLAASQIPGVSVSTDWTSANFGKIRKGDTRIDLLAGFNPLIVLTMRLIMGKSTSSTTGKTQNLEGGFGKSSQYDILQRFFESKMSPSLGIGRDVLKHRTFIGEPVTVGGEIKNSIPPMMIKDALEVASEPQDPAQQKAAFALAFILGGFGVGFSSYGAKAAKSSGGGGGESPTWDSGGGGEAPTWDSGGSDAGPVWTP